jgi:FkbM family methyltransferase
MRARRLAKAALAAFPAIAARALDAVERLRRAAAIVRLPNRDVTVPVFGLQLTVRNPRQSIIGLSLFKAGIWEAEVTRFIAGRVQPGMNVIDVGADVGYYTLLFAAHVGLHGRVVAFEPIPASKALLDRNIAQNLLSNVVSCDFALGDQAGCFVLEAPLNKSRVALHKGQPEAGDIEIKIRIFDEWRDTMRIGAVHLVKIDVEGAELMVLQGMKRTLREDRPALLIEIHPMYLPQFGHSAEDLAMFLEQLGYRGMPIDRSTLSFDQGVITVYWEHERT